MLAYAFSSLSEAEAFIAALDGRLGYPRPGVNVGGGVHVSLGEEPGPGWTLHASDVWPHPNGQLWGVPVDEPSLEAALDLRANDPAWAELGSAVPLTDDWLPQRPGA